MHVFIGPTDSFACIQKKRERKKNNLSLPPSPKLAAKKTLKSFTEAR